MWLYQVDKVCRREVDPVEGSATIKATIRGNGFKPFSYTPYGSKHDRALRVIIKDLHRFTS